jgi:predicted branched-subunit amino acid permease
VITDRGLTAYLDGIRVVGPLAFAIGALGVAFGYLARTAGLSSMASITMSATTFAGSPQFAAVSIFGGGGTMFAAVGAAAMLASRFTAMSATVAPNLKGPLWRRLLLSQLVVDETWAVAYIGAAGFDTRRLIGAGVELYIVHIGATAIGAVIGGAIGNVEALGVDAMSPALFVVLLRSRLGDRRSRIAAALAGGIALIATPLTPPGVPISLALGAVLVIALSSGIFADPGCRGRFQ